MRHQGRRHVAEPNYPFSVADATWTHATQDAAAAITARVRVRGMITETALVAASAVTPL